MANGKPLCMKCKRNKRGSRGLCFGCRQLLQAKIVLGFTTDEDEVKRGNILPRETPGRKRPSMKVTRKAKA